MKISKVREVKTPTRGTPYSAGIDFYVPEDHFPIMVRPGESAIIPSGIKANVPSGYAFVAFNKSGIALKKSLMVGACVVDEDYQGEIHLHVINVGTQDQRISPGEKLIQLLLVKVSYDDVEETGEENLFSTLSIRGSGGFGSTGDF